MNLLRGTVLFAALLVLLAVVRSDTSEAGFIIHTIDTTSDDGNLDDCGVATPNDCSLRGALTLAQTFTVDEIHFGIPGTDPNCSGGVCTISPQSLLPAITTLGGLLVDGYTQAGAAPNTNGPGLGSNAQIKIQIDGSQAPLDTSGLIIGGTNNGVRGISVTNFSGNGITVTGEDAYVKGNWIGVTPLGGAQGNGDGDFEGGVWVQDPNAAIGGTDPADRNFIAANNAGGVVLFGGTGHVVEGNIVGGPLTFGNSQDGVVVYNFTSGAVIGGDTPAARNVISGNDGDGIYVAGPDAHIWGNYIGTDTAGTGPVPNGGNGVHIFDTDTVEIGGWQSGVGIIPGTGNVISGNTLAGVLIEQSNAVSVLGSLIGATAGGASALGNGGAGIRIIDSNGTVPLENIIAHNVGDGVAVESGTGNEITTNAIHSNGGLGIDLGDDGVTLNDAGDADAGPNNGQNFPEITEATAGSITVNGTFDSQPDTLFIFELYVNDECDPSGYGEGQMLLDYHNAMTDADGVIDFTVSLPQDATGMYVTATAYASSGGVGTSEFSNCVEVVAPNTPTPTPSPTVTGSTGTPTPTATATGTPTPTPTATISGQTPAPTPSPTMTAETSSSSPASQTATPTPTAAPPFGELWGDVDCNDGIDPVDSLKLLRYDAGLSVAQNDGCPPLGQPHGDNLWGDADCSGQVDPIDSLKTLRHDAGLDIAQETGCHEMGATV